MVGFVREIAPHLMRMVVGADNRQRILATTVFDAILLCVADATMCTRLAQAHNITGAAILHDLTLAKLYAEEVILLKSGKIFASGLVRSVENAETIAALYSVEHGLADAALEAFSSGQVHFRDNCALYCSPKHGALLNWHQSGQSRPV